MSATDHTTSTHPVATRRSSNFRHGETRTRLHQTWVGMRQRCCNPKDAAYAAYGGRGITICPEWSDYLAFRDWALQNGYHDDLTIERNDVNGNYEPGNCSWIPHAAQARNKRTTRLVTAFGETKCVAAWLEDPRCVVGITTFYGRINKGWLPEEALAADVGATQPSIVKAREMLASSFVPDYSKEVWRPVPGWAGYDVSDCGRVRTYWRRRVIARPPDEKWRPRGKTISVIVDTSHLKATPIDKQGRPKADLIDGKGGRKTFLVSHLVLLAFKGPAPPGMCARHYPNLHPGDCTSGNLSWAPESQVREDWKQFRRSVRETVDLSEHS